MIIVYVSLVIHSIINFLLKIKKKVIRIFVKTNKKCICISHFNTHLTTLSYKNVFTFLFVTNI